MFKLLVGWSLRLNATEDWFGPFILNIEAFFFFQVYFQNES